MGIMYGRVMRVQDGVIALTPIPDVRIGEFVVIYTEQQKGAGSSGGNAVANDATAIGYIMDVYMDELRAVLISGNTAAGALVRRLFHGPKTQAGGGVLNQIITPFGVPIATTTTDPWEFFYRREYGCVQIDIERRHVPGVTQREPVRVPVNTGLSAIDCYFPIGHGQRELLIGDIKTGKTSIGLTAIINQGRWNKADWMWDWSTLSPELGVDSAVFIPCVYVAVGQRRAELVRMRSVLMRYNAMRYTCIIFTASDTRASIQYLAPYAGCAIAEWFMARGYRTLMLFDDLTQHAMAYRQISLLLRRPPAREAYPGDIFYIHARLLERAAQVGHKNSGGSITIIPVIETQLGDISAYISTNVISITDGQLFLSRKIAHTGRRPSIDFGLSVSRIGSAAQVPCIVYVFKMAKACYANYRRFVSLERVGNELPVFIRKFLERGKRLNKFMTQAQYKTHSMFVQFVGTYWFSGTEADDVDVKYVPLLVRIMEELSYQFVYNMEIRALFGVQRTSNAAVNSMKPVVMRAKLNKITTTMLDMEGVLAAIEIPQV